MSAAASPAVKEARQARAGYPASSARFDTLMAGLSFLFLAGLWVDGWAHFHGKVDDILHDGDGEARLIATMTGTLMVVSGRDGMAG